MPKTLTEKLKAIKAAGKGIFVPYIMAGDHEKGLDGLAEKMEKEGTAEKVVSKVKEVAEDAKDAVEGAIEGVKNMLHKDEK